MYKIHALILCTYINDKKLKRVKNWSKNTHARAPKIKRYVVRPNDMQQPPRTGNNLNYTSLSLLPGISPAGLKLGSTRPSSCLGHISLIRSPNPMPFEAFYHIFNPLSFFSNHLLKKHKIICQKMVNPK